jgi:hypothetical protein
MYVLSIVVCPFVLFHLAIVLSVLLRYVVSDYPFGIFKLLWIDIKLFVLLRLYNFINHTLYVPSSMTVFKGYGLRCLKSTFSNISVILWGSFLLVEETKVPGENHRPFTSHWQTLSHNIVRRTHRHALKCLRDCEVCPSVYLMISVILTNVPTLF